MNLPKLVVDPGLLDRFRAAGRKMTWRPVVEAGRDSRIAHLHDEECRVESEGKGEGFRLRVEPGPVGALILLLEIDRRGPPGALEATDAGPEPFGRGALEARWGSVGGALGGRAIPTSDLVGVARYALA